MTADWQLIEMSATVMCSDKMTAKWNKHHCEVTVMCGDRMTGNWWAHGIDNGRWWWKGRWWVCRSSKAGNTSRTTSTYHYWSLQAIRPTCDRVHVQQRPATRQRTLTNGSQSQHITTSTTTRKLARENTKANELCDLTKSRGLFLLHISYTWSVNRTNGSMSRTATTSTFLYTYGGRGFGHNESHIDDR